MLYITGDTHGDWMSRLNSEAFPEGDDMSKDDYVIICGDFGIWHDTNDLNYRLYWLDERPFTTLFVDGNHENFDRLDTYPIEKWNGGKIHKINDSVYHLMRGQVFTIEGLTFFTFGGAQSHDIQDGIFERDQKEKIKEANERGLSFRINHVSWWARELPSTSEMKEGFINLALNKNKVDFIVSHSPHISLLRKLGYTDTDNLSLYLEEIRSIVDFRLHFFGHMHINQNFPEEKAIGLYEQIIRIK